MMILISTCSTDTLKEIKFKCFEIKKTIGEPLSVPIRLVFKTHRKPYNKNSSKCWNTN